MPARFETLYKWLKRTPIDDEQLNKRFRDVDDRFNALEVLKIAWEEALRIVQDRVLGQSELVIASLRDRLLSITQLQWLVAESATSITFVEDAARSVAIVEADRDLFAPGPFAILSSIADPDVYAVVRTLAYDRDLGQYDLQVVSFAGGAGPHGPFHVGAVAGSTLAQMTSLAESKAIRDQVEAKRVEVETKRGQAVAAAGVAADAALAAAADRVQTGLDRAAAAQSAVDAATFNPASYYPKSATDTLLAGKAPLASPAFTGNPTAPTPAAGDNDTSVATTEFVSTAVAGKASLAGATFTGRVNLEFSTLAANTGAANFALRNGYIVSQTAAMTLTVSNLADGQDGQVNLTYTAGALSFAGVDRWVVGNDEVATAFSATTVGATGLVATGVYQFVFSKAADIVVGRVGRVK